MLELLSCLSEIKLKKMHKFDLMKEKLKLSYAGNEFDRVIEFNCFFLDINANCVLFLSFFEFEMSFYGLALQN